MSEFAVLGAPCCIFTLILSAVLLVVFWFHPPAPADWGNDPISDSANTCHFAVLAECVVGWVGALASLSKAKVHAQSVYVAALKAV